MAAFSLRLDLAKEVNCHFLENDYGDLSFFSVVLHWVVNFSVLNKKQSSEMCIWLAIVTIIMVLLSYIDLYGINKVLLLLNEHGDPSFLFPNLSSYNINNQLAKVWEKSQCRFYFGGMTLSYSWTKTLMLVSKIVNEKFASSNYR